MEDPSPNFVVCNLKALRRAKLFFLSIGWFANEERTL